MSFNILNKMNIYSKVLVPKGINAFENNLNFLSESINLEYGEKCSSRGARKKVFPTESPVSQVINCSDRMFLRFGNSVRELVKENNVFSFGEQYSLTDYSADTDRIFVSFGSDIYIFPDNLVLTEGNGEWKEFAADEVVNVKIPFIDSYGLYYTSGYDGGISCDITSLSEGTEIKFSWQSDEVFKIVKIETITLNEGGSLINQGQMVWLDKPVSQINSIPSDAYAFIRIPKIAPAEKSVYVGYGNRGGSFFGRYLSFNTIENCNEYSSQICSKLYPGQTVRISGAKIIGNSTVAKITDVTEGLISFDCYFTDELLSYGQIIKITPVLPDVSFAQVYDNRLFIADNKKCRFLASKQGKPLVFCEKDNTPDGSLVLEQAKECTGLTVYKDRLLLFNNSGGFRLCGENRDEYSLIPITVSGIGKGRSDTLCEFWDSLFYISDMGVMKYSGSIDEKISGGISLVNPTFAAAAGGRVYILDNDLIYVYNLDNKRWWCENAEGISSVFVFEGHIFYLKDEGIYAKSGENFPVEWSFTTLELPKETGGRVQPVTLKTEIFSKDGCELYIYLRRKGENLPKQIFAGFIKEESTLNIPLQKVWCNGFDLSFKGKGDITFHNFCINYRRK